eukprot:362161-Chlamydomonas_euryale.AAC.7
MKARSAGKVVHISYQNHIDATNAFNAPGSRCKSCNALFRMMSMKACRDIGKEFEPHGVKRNAAPGNPPSQLRGVRLGVCLGKAIAQVATRQPACRKRNAAAHGGANAAATGPPGGGARGAADGGSHARRPGRGARCLARGLVGVA